MTGLKIFASFGMMNALFIGTTNIYAGFKDSYFDIRQSVRDQDNVFEKIAMPTALSVVSVVKVITIPAVKSAYFFALGPIGTYRICLACERYRLSGDRRYIKVLTTPESSVYSKNTPYIMKPFGGMSWISY